MNKIILRIIIIGMILFVIGVLGVVLVASLEISKPSDIAATYLLLIAVLVNTYIVYKIFPRRNKEYKKEIKHEQYEEFEKIHRELLKTYKTEIDKYRKPIVRKRMCEIILLIIAVLGNVIGVKILNIYLCLFGILSLIAFFISLQVKSNAIDSYKIAYNEKVVTGMIDLLSSTSNNITENYIIKYKLNNGKINYANCVRENAKLENKTNGLKDNMYVSVGEGIGVKIETQKNISASIIIANNSASPSLLSSKLAKIEMDNREFEKNFNVYSDNSIIAMQLLTSDIMETVMKFKQRFGTNMELRVNKNTIQLFFYMEDAFESSVFSRNLNKSKLLEHYLLLTTIRKISFETYEIVLNLEV